MDPLTDGAAALKALDEAKTVHGIMALIIVAQLGLLYLAARVIWELLKERKDIEKERLTDRDTAADRLVKATEKQVNQNERLVIAVERLTGGDRHDD